MMFLRLLPVILSLLLLGAHFSRAGLALPMLASLALLVVLAIPRAWAARLVQVALVLGTVEWLRTVYVLVRVRQAMGEPWTRAAIIIGAVAVFTACSWLVFQSAAVRRRFGLTRADAADG
jgi:hypothetical protein